MDEAQSLPKEDFWEGRHFTPLFVFYFTFFSTDKTEPKLGGSFLSFPFPLCFLKPLMWSEGDDSETFSFLFLFFLQRFSEFFFYKDPAASLMTL